MHQEVSRSRPAPFGHGFSYWHGLQMVVPGMQHPAAVQTVPAGQQQGLPVTSLQHREAPVVGSSGQQSPAPQQTVPAPQQKVFVPVVSVQHWSGSQHSLPPQQISPSAQQESTPAAFGQHWCGSQQSAPPQQISLSPQQKGFPVVGSLQHSVVFASGLSGQQMVPAQHSVSSGQQNIRVPAWPPQQAASSEQQMTWQFVGLTAHGNPPACTQCWQLLTHAPWHPLACPGSRS